MSNLQWRVYLVRCSDGSLYCGVTKDLKRRIEQHNAGTRGAKYTRSRRPVFLVWHGKSLSKSEAFKEEYRIKKMRKFDKERMVASFNIDACNVDNTNIG